MPVIALPTDILASRSTQKCETGYEIKTVLSEGDAAVADRLMGIYRQCVEHDKCLLCLPFTSVHEYLHSLKVVP